MRIRLKPVDYAKALAVAVAVLVVTLAASFPMVAFYAYFIEPGHPQAFYTDAAQWIAPWSSHVLGPLLFFGFNFWLARRNPARNAVAFAVAAIVAYVIVDVGLVFLGGYDIRAVLTPVFGLSLAAKLAGALLGARFATVGAASAAIG